MLSFSHSFKHLYKRDVIILPLLFLLWGWLNIHLGLPSIVVDSSRERTTHRSLYLCNIQVRVLYILYIHTMVLTSIHANAIYNFQYENIFLYLGGCRTDWEWGGGGGKSSQNKQKRKRKIKCFKYCTLREYEKCIFVLFVGIYVFYNYCTCVLFYT